MSCRSETHKPGATFKDVKMREKELKKISKSGGELAGFPFRESLIEICTSTPNLPLNWKIENGKLKEWIPTGTFDDVTGKVKHVPVAHAISWFFLDRLGAFHVGTSSTHYKLIWKNQYTPPRGTTFPTQSREEIEELIMKICHSALQDDDSSDSSKSKDYSIPHFIPSKRFIEGLLVEEPDQWQLHYDESKRTTFLIGAETIELHWYYKHHGLYVGNKSRHFSLKRSKRASYSDSAGRRVALQDDVAIKVALAVLERAV